MKIMAEQFIVGETIDGAIERAAPREALGYRYSYDMLGEAARTAADAERYFAAYEAAIDAVGRAADGAANIEARPGISIKLSALHPRYEVAQERRVFGELLPRIEALAERAAGAGIPVTLDAEEADRLELSLELFERLARAPSLAGWDGLGLAVQAYQRRAIHVCDWLVALAADARRRLMVRLVKGAYWDTEIKLAQVLGLDDYPVFTRKQATDVSYIACAQALLAAGERIFPQFATHNSHSVATVLECAGERRDFEFQKLHGMGDALYDALVPETGHRVPRLRAGRRPSRPARLSRAPACSRTAPTAPSSTRSATRTRRSSGWWRTRSKRCRVRTRRIRACPGRATCCPTGSTRAASTSPIARCSRGSRSGSPPIGPPRPRHPAPARSPSPRTAAGSSARCGTRPRPSWTRACARLRRRGGAGTRRRPRSAHARSSAPPTCSRTRPTS